MRYFASALIIGFALAANLVSDIFIRPKNEKLAESWDEVTGLTWIFALALFALFAVNDWSKRRGA